MSRTARVNERLTTALDPIMTAAAIDTGDARQDWIAHAVEALAAVGASAMREALAADLEQETDALAAAMAWSRARGLTEAVETLARHIAPDTYQLEPEDTRP